MLKRPWLPLLCVAIAITTIEYVIHQRLQNVNETTGKAATRHGTGGANRTANVIDVELRNNSTSSESHIVDEIASSQVGAFFDCKHEQSKCRYFVPGEFYKHYYLSHVANNLTTQNNDDIHRTNYTAKAATTTNNAEYFANDEQYIQWRKEIGLENANLPALDSLSWWIGEGGSASSTDNGIVVNKLKPFHINIPQNMTYIHVHKCGGTSIQGAMYRRARHLRHTELNILTDNNSTNTQQTANLDADMHTYKHSFGGGSKEKKAKWDAQRLNHIQTIANTQVQSPQSTTVPSNHFPIFTVVRDPIQRFLSATQQVMHYNTEFRDKCLFEEESTKSFLSLISRQNKEEREAILRRKTIQCAIHDMKETQYRRDVHLVPIASHFRLLDDVAVSVFYMDDIQDVLSHLLGNGVDQSSGSSGSSSNTQQPAKPVSIHARDRSNVEYATSSILARLSTNDCDEEMIQQICTLYDVDVKLMKWLGFGGEAVERCG